MSRKIVRERQVILKLIGPGDSLRRDGEIEDPRFTIATPSGNLVGISTPPDFIVAPEGSEELWEVVDTVTSAGPLTCPDCGYADFGVDHGWVVETPRKEKYLVTQCTNTACGSFLFVALI